MVIHITTNKHIPDKRKLHRRETTERRTYTRFGDILGRRSGVDRRITDDNCQTSSAN